MRSFSAASSAARREENNPRVRPPAAMMRSFISSSVSGAKPSRPGAGRWEATYKMPDFAGSKGVPASMESHVPRSEEHTSELQSRFDIVCRLLLVKKKNVYYEYII